MHLTFFIFLCFSPWSDSPYKDAVEKNVLGGLSLDGFLSEVCENAIFIFLFGILCIITL